MSNVVVVGAQWGDEGKGKIVDWLASQADVVVRFQGGHNAGHTLVVGGISYKLNLLPSGVVRGTPSIIGNGVVVDPWALLNEIEKIATQGVYVTPQTLMLAENAPLLLPVHAHLDRAREEAAGSARIGTTGRGIGPAYEDKVARRAIRVCDLADGTLAEKTDRLLAHHNALLRGLGAPVLDRDAVLASLQDLAPRLLPYAKAVWKELNSYQKKGARILFEGAQGIMLDVDFGTYPYVTSSNTLAGQVGLGCGIGPRNVGYVLGIAKAYATRVGAGPFPTELTDADGETLGARGHEFGTVTGRKRRCGWFDAVLARQAATISGIDGIALTKLDVLDGFKSVKICVGYRLNGSTWDYLPSSVGGQAGVEAIYEELGGWEESTKGTRSFSELPPAAVKYVRRIEELIERPIVLLSTSPERDDTILIQNPFEN